MLKIIKYIIVNAYSIEHEAIELLYDLIKADLVEKID